MKHHSPKKTRRVLRVEQLDERLLLALDTVYISEFLANNDSTLADNDGEFSDWIELHNPTTEPVNLSGWSLTDSANDRTKWILPSITIPSQGFRVVFASEKDRRDPAAELHTNFKLTTDGEYLALVKPDQTIAHEFSPSFPEQTSDVSFGFAVQEIPLVHSDSVRSFRVPSAEDGPLNDTWVQTTFDDSSWRETRGAIGYDNRPRLENASFESKDLSLWQNLGPVSVVDGSFGVSPNDGVHMALVTTRGSTTTRAGAERFLGLSSRALDAVAGGGVQRATSIKREFAVKAGSVMTLDWNFLTSDPRQGDFAFVVVSDSQGARLLADQSSNLTGTSAPGFNQESGFRRFTHTFAAAGNYTIGIGVTQVIDLNADSAVLVDNLQIDGVGDTGSSYESIVKTRIADELSTNNSVWWRQDFSYDPLAAIQSLVLRVRYDDGFAAFINGQRIAGRNSAEVLTWNSSATNSHANLEAIEFEDVVIPVPNGLLVPGTNLLAIQGLNAESDLGDFLLDAELVGVGLPSEEPSFLRRSSPGAANLSLSFGYVDEVRFDRPHGFFDAPFALSMTTSTPDATIRYTTNGSVPTVNSGQIYTGPITINRTTIIRAGAFKDGLIPRGTNTASFLFVDDIINQSTRSATAAGFPSTWNGSRADYEMDPDVIGPNGRDRFGGKYTRTIRDDLLSLPSLSLVMNRDDLFGAEGIYVNPQSRGEQWERPTSVELIHPDGTAGFQVDAGLRIQGGISRVSSDKLAMRLSFRERYGDPNLQYPLFGVDGPDEFDSIALRSSGGETFVGFHYIRDEFVRRAEQNTGNPSALGNFVHLYINGLYWGVYNPAERIDAQFAVTREGGAKDDFDIYNAGDLENQRITAIHGTMAAWTRLVALANDIGSAANATARNAAFMRLQGRHPDGTNDPNLESYLDVDNYINYLIINVYAGNLDWPHRNYYMYRQRGEASEGFKFQVWDAEFTLDAGDPSRRIPSLNQDPTVIVADLLKSEAFRVRFADQVHKLFSPGGALYVNPASTRWDPNQPENNLPARTYAEIVDSVRSGIVAESARWGDERGQPNPPFTRDEDWTTVVNSNLNQFFPRRSATFLSQLRSDDLNRDAPTFAPAPGGVDAGSTVTLTPRGGAVVYYTTDGSDPRLVDGTVSPSAIRYSEPILINQRSLIRTRSLAATKWSAINEGTYLIGEVPASSSNMRITEVNFNPHDPATQFDEIGTDNDQFEFIELANVGSASIDLTGVKLVSRFGHGVDFEFGSQSLAAGQRVVVPRDRTAFTSRYPGNVRLAIAAAGSESDWVYSGDLANNGDTILIVDSRGQTIQKLSYGDSEQWPARADGNGSSLEMADLQADPNVPAAWRASSEFGGSPGAAGLGPDDRIVFNEILANPGENATDFIELFNHTSAAIDMRNWYISDSRGDYFRFKVEPSTVIPASGYHVFTDVELGFGLSASQGEEIHLIEGAANGRPLRFVDEISFGPTSTGVSVGRWPNGDGPIYPMNRLSPAAANRGPRTPEILISEIQSSVAPSQDEIVERDFEFVELYNSTDRSIDVSAWRADGDVRYQFPANTVIDAGRAVVLVSFDAAAESAKSTIFRLLYGVGTDVRLIGPYAGDLPAATGVIRLMRPEPIPDNDETPLALEDEVRYDSQAPWPTDAVRNDKSIHRATAEAFGSFGVSWRTAQASPGKFTPADLVIDADDVDLVCQAIVGEQHNPRYDLNGDGQVTQRDLNFLIEAVLLSGPGDANLDRRFNSADLVLIFTAGEYEDEIAGNSTWSEGDWNCDGEFSTLDLVLAFQQVTYETIAG